MNRTVLIPILLSTFFLVGCESEFDRCIVANSGDFDEDQFNEKLNERVMPDIPPMDTKEELQGVINENERIFKLSLTAVELQVYNCGTETYNDRREELFYELFYVQGLSENEIYEKIWLSEPDITNSCIKKVKTKAKKICNSQGIY